VSREIYLVIGVFKFLRSKNFSLFFKSSLLLALFVVGCLDKRGVFGIDFLLELLEFY